MRVSEAFPSKYLKAADIPPGREAVVTICAVEVEAIDDDQHKPVLYFMGKTKGFMLNRTNADTLAQAYGDEMDSRIGKRIGIFSTTTLFRGTRTPCLRCRPAPAPTPAGFPQPPSPQPAPPPAPAAPAPVDGERRFDQGDQQEWAGDDIPF